MRAVVQRVAYCNVEAGGETVGEIGNGMLILLGVKKGDTEKEAEKLSAKISGLRIFTDENEKMNLSLADIGGEMLVVSQFTLCTDCRRGRRPDFGEAAGKDAAEPLYEYFCECMEKIGIGKVERGVFGADMKVSLLNDGPVTLMLDTDNLS